MARTAKKTQVEAGLGFESPAEEAVEAQSPPMVKETHRVVRTWAEEKPISEFEEEDFDETEEEPAEEIAPSPDDPIAKVLNEIAGSRSNWSLQVARLPNYDRDNRTDPKSRRHCGVLSIPDADYLKEERYLEDLQHKFARGQNGNWFLMCVRRDNRNFAYLPPVCVEPPLPEVMAAKAAESNGSAPINIYNPSVPAVDGFKQFIAQAKQFAELRDLLFPGGPVAAVPASNAHNEPLTDERALLHILNREGDIVDSVTSKLKGLLRNGNGGSEEKGVWDVVVAALTSPTLPQTIQMLVQQFRDAAPPHQTNPNQAPPTHQPQQPPPDVLMIQRLRQILVETLKLNGDVAPVLRAIDGLVMYFPQHQFTVENLMNADTQQLLATLPQMYPPAAEAVGLPHAAEWIERLKAEYFGEGEGEDPQQ